MANIHRIGDLENIGNNGNIPQGEAPPNDIPFLYNYYDQPQKDPRQENFFDFLTYTCCPRFQFKSFIVGISVVQVVIFIVSLSLSPVIKGQFLQPATITLVELGAKYPYLMKEGYFWLFLTPVLLHANFMHIFSNLVGQFIFGTELEKRLGTLKMSIFYILTACSGNLFSALISDNISVGASTSIMGMLACMLGYLLINWDALERYGSARCMVLCMVIVMLLLNIMMGIGSTTTIDNYGHLGGFFIGFVLSFLVVVPIQQQQQFHMYKKIALAVVVLYFVIGFVLFYVFRHPAKLVGM